MILPCNIENVLTSIANTFFTSKPCEPSVKVELVNDEVIVKVYCKGIEEANMERKIKHINNDLMNSFICFLSNCFAVKEDKELIPLSSFKNIKVEYIKC